MNNFALISALSSYATTNDMVFLYGQNYMQNYEASQHEYYNGQKVLTGEFTCQPVYGNGNKIGQITYNGVLGLGQKFDDDGTANIPDDENTPLVDETQTFNDGTPSSLDETQMQKYNRRLYDLMVALDIVIQDIACENELQIGTAIFRMDMNKFDTNIDFVVAEISFIQ
jgi:hypothetical protein